MDIPKRTDVVVLGAGPSGLAFVKELREVGSEVVCFEKYRRCGGLFAKAYPSLSLTSSTATTAYSDYNSTELNVSPKHWPVAEYLKYLDGYIEHFGFGDSLFFNTEVTEVEPHSEGFRVTYRSRGKPKKTIIATRIAICAGTHRLKKRPTFKNEERFRGDIVHAQDYRGAEPYTGKRVVVVGGGEGAADILLEVGAVAERTASSVRSGWGHMLFRTLSEIGIPDETPTDIDTSRMHHALPHWTGPLLQGWLWRYNLRSGLHNDLPALRILSEINLRQRSSDATSFGCKTAAAAIAMARYNVEEYGVISDVEEGGVWFKDGTFFPCDVILCATGYSTGFCFLEKHFPSLATQAKQPRKYLYKHCFHPEYGDKIVWGGFSRPAFGAVPPMAEMQARWFAQMVAGRCVLPDTEEMRARCAIDDELAITQFGDQARNLAPLTDFLRYMDSVAEEIGCMPPDLFFEDRPLWLKINFGPINGSQYRLRGPSSNFRAARKRILDTPIIYKGSYLAVALACSAAEKIPVLGKKFRMNARPVW